jgi:XTP/dITP diphosphohydrolase
VELQKLKGGTDTIENLRYFCRCIIGLLRELKNKNVLMELVFATQNKNKAAEIQQLLPASIQVKTLAEIGCTADIPETADNLADNARQKSTYVVAKFGVNCFADDTGLEIDALGGEPGVYSARYAGPQKDSADNMDLVLAKMQGVTNRAARFKTVISLILDGEEIQFEGVAEGNIRTEKSGTAGFGYDPIFEPQGFTCTFSEMTLAEKNKISHRGKAIAKLISFLTSKSED